MPFKWIRRWVRRSTRPIEYNTAGVWKQRLSLAYGILAWNALAFVGYAVYNGKRDWAAYHGMETDKSTPAQYYSKVLDIPKAKVIRYDGFTRKEEFEIDNTGIFDNIKTIPPIGQTNKTTEVDSEQ